MQETTVSTAHLRAEQRTSLIRDTAFNFFNLEVDLGGAEPGSLAADIHIARGPVASVIDVNTSWSVVERTRARANAATTGNFLVYLIGRGGSWFENEQGDQFKTAAGSVVVGSQDAAYKAVAAHGQDWRFHAVSVSERLFSFAGAGIRRAGFQLVPPHAPLNALLSSYMGALCREFPQLDEASGTAALTALDHLLAAALGAKAPPDAGLAQTVAAQRRRAALDYIESQRERADLSPATVARHLHISPRQLHRVFEASGRGVAAEIRRVRLERARDMIARHPAMAITDIALSCGFDSLATFYRSFKACFGMTATELRGERLR